MTKVFKNGERAPGYRLSPDHFQTAPNWAQNILCIIVPNRRTTTLESLSCVLITVISPYLSGLFTKVAGTLILTFLTRG